MTFDYRLEQPAESRSYRRDLERAEDAAARLYDDVLLPLDLESNQRLMLCLPEAEVEDSGPVLHCLLVIRRLECDGKEALGLAARLRELAELVEARAGT